MQVSFLNQMIQGRGIAHEIVQLLSGPNSRIFPFYISTQSNGLPLAFSYTLSLTWLLPHSPESWHLLSSSPHLHLCPSILKRDPSTFSQYVFCSSLHSLKVTFPSLMSPFIIAWPLDTLTHIKIHIYRNTHLLDLHQRDNTELPYFNNILFNTHP